MGLGSRLGRILIFSILGPWLALAVCLAFFAAHPEDWTIPVGVGVFALVAIVSFHPWLRRVEEQLPRPDRPAFRVARITAEIVCPIAAVALGGYLYADQIGFLP